MDIGSAQIVAQLISGAKGALTAYAPVFLLIGGIVLAFGIIERLIYIFFPNVSKDDTMEKG